MTWLKRVSSFLLIASLLACASTKQVTKSENSDFVRWTNVSLYDSIYFFSMGQMNMPESISFPSLIVRHANLKVNDTVSSKSNESSVIQKSRSNNHYTNRIFGFRWLAIFLLVFLLLFLVVRRRK